MRVSFHVPESRVKRTGNRCTAAQWAEILTSLGHEVVEASADAVDVLIALHAGFSHDAIRQFRRSQPAGKLIVALTGSDIYPAPDERVLGSIELADRVVILQPKARDQIPERFREKVRVIIQSAQQLLSAERLIPSESTFDVCVVGHFRDVKDPLRAAAASRLLSEDSTIQIRHAGGILEPKYHELVEREAETNRRFQWLGELDENAVADLIASSRLMVISSEFEGGARVVGEATVLGTPTISSRIAGVVGLLGDDYPGYFPPGDTAALAELLRRAETDPQFLEQLNRRTDELAPQFHPDRETEGWKKLIEELRDDSAAADSQPMG
ncbi:MAG: putative glycosyltransferase (TIGR04348 family) [Verrucomicrobiales bacterium]|jgi:putative glycosyltransferase (TIGR04348 family)